MNAEIIEGNKLIAEFTGFNVTEFVWKESLGLVHCDEDGNFEIDEDLDYYSPNTDWNDLMPAVEKIEKTNIVIINGESCEIKTMPFSLQIENDVEQKRCHTYENYIANPKSKILAVWECVVGFIKWYNQN